MFLIASIAVGLAMTRMEGAMSVYGAAALAYLAAKLALSLAYRPSDIEPGPVDGVAVILPFYNEDEAILRASLASILAQSRPADAIVVVDDGSASTACFEMAREMLAGSSHPGAIVHRLSSNCGKRHAQAWAVRRIRSEIIITVDSDTVLDRDAFREGLRPFGDPEVQGVTGNVQVLNEGTNLLTHLTSVRYANAFLWERAAYSVAGAVLCACGSLSFWRRGVLADNLTDYTSQRFAGVSVMFGDDRRLTNYALTRGRVQFQDSAVAYTTVPERLHHYVRQQTRWNKSFFRETLWALRRFRPWSRVGLFSLGEIGLWCVFTLSLVGLVIVYPLWVGQLPSAWLLVFLSLMAYARSVRYLGSQRTPMRRQIGIYLLAPLYGLMHICLLTPIRVWSLLTLRRAGWGTRSRVEVTLGEDPLREPARRSSPVPHPLSP